MCKQRCHVFLLAAAGTFFVNTRKTEISYDAAFFLSFSLSPLHTIIQIEKCAGAHSQQHTFCIYILFALDTYARILVAAKQ